MVVKTKKTGSSSKAKKVTVKPSVKKKTVAHTTPAKKAVVSVIKETLTKTEMVNKLSEMTELARKQVIELLEGLSSLIGASVKKGGSGVFILPGLMKIMVVRKPATKARKGINPFTGEETVFKAKPARNVVKIRPLKKIKDMAE